MRDELYERAVRQLRHTVEMGTNLTRQLLAFCRRQVFHPTLLDANQVVGDMAEMLKGVIGGPIRMEWGRSEDAGCVYADAGQLQQAILNLALNARDAMPEGGTLTIRTSRVVLDDAAAAARGVAAGPYVRISVADTGTGMDEAARERRFEPFFTTKPLGQGTGLGLAGVYGFVKQVGGHVEVETEVGRGTTVSLLLPSTADAVGRGHDDPPPGSPNAAGQTVLVCEDEPMVRGLIARQLARAGYRVLEAETGEQALDLGVGYSPPVRVLVTDMTLPGMDGLELVRRLRERT